MAMTIISIYVILVLAHVPCGAKHSKHTQGYLFGFILSVMLSTFLLHCTDYHGQPTFFNSFVQQVGIYFLANTVILIAGAMFYWHKTGFGPEHSVYPFVIGGAIKIVVAAAITSIL
jgi:biotin transporter BioY